MTAAEQARAELERRRAERPPKAELDDGAPHQPIKTQSEPRKSKKRRAADVVQDILQRKDEHWPAIALGGQSILEVRPGGIVELIGGTGRGKTSLAATILLEHARDHGPALSMSLELTADEWVARAIGTRRDASWPDVLRGRISEDEMRSALPERLHIIDRVEATLDELDLAADELAAEFAGQPLLVAIDYVQLVRSEEREIRARIGDVMDRIDRHARSRRDVIIALSQGSRNSSNALASGEKVGADTTDAGAESANLERWATATIAIGQWVTQAEDGSVGVELSFGKGRMTGGDRVFPARYFGRSGLWRLAGEAKTGTAVREGRAAEQNEQKKAAAKLAMLAGIERATAPMTREELGGLAACRPNIWRPGLSELIGRGEIVEVDRRRPRAKSWLLWTRSLAETAGIPIVADLESER